MQEILDIIESIKKENKLVIVEGLSDKQALEKFGISNIILSASKPTFKLIEEIPESTKEIVILTDLDKEGRKQYSKIKHNCLKRGIKTDDSLRNYLFKNSEISHIEGLKVKD